MNIIFFHFIISFLNMQKINKNTIDFEGEKDYLKTVIDLLIPHVKEESIAEMISYTALQIEKYELAIQIKKTEKESDTTFLKIKETYKTLEIILNNNLDLKTLPIRNHMKRLLSEINKQFEINGIKYFKEHRKLEQKNQNLKNENQDLKNENERLKLMLNYYNIIDVDDM